MQRILCARRRLQPVLFRTELLSFLHVVVWKRISGEAGADVSSFSRPGSAGG